jgi:hypothetical protein
MFPSLHSPEPRYGVRPYYTIHLIALLNRIRVLVADTIVSATRDTRYSSFIYCLRRLYPFKSPFPETARISRLLNLTEESIRSSGLNTYFESMGNDLSLPVGRFETRRSSSSSFFTLCLVHISFGAHKPCKCIGSSTSAKPRSGGLGHCPRHAIPSARNQRWLTNLQS